MAFWRAASLFLVALTVLMFPALEGRTVTEGESRQLSKKEADLLKSLGYFPSTRGMSDVSSEVSAISAFQRTWGLKVTGEMNTETRDQLGQPRCGDADSDIIMEEDGSRAKRYDPVSKWGRCSLTYRIKNYESDDYYTPDLSDAEVEETFALAAKYWTDHVPGLSITPTSSGEDMTVYFGAKCHGDGGCFDGKSGVLAHAYYPKGGDVHFDEDETWVLSGTSGGKFDFLQVAVHELGHSLGLGHSKEGGAIMRPYISTNWNRKLGSDDIAGIKTRFSCGGSDETTTPPTTTAPPTTPALTTPAGTDATTGTTAAQPTTAPGAKPCDSSPCQNGGTCRNALSKFYFCFCRPGYMGKNCQRKFP